mgnify:CR=1 FL=1
MSNKIKVTGYIILVIVIIFFMIAVNENNKKRNIEEVVSEFSTTVYPLGVAETTTEQMEATTESSLNGADGWDYKIPIESIIKETFPNAKFDKFVNFRTWSDGTFTLLENKFEVDGVDHTYVARCGGGKLFHLNIDDVAVFYDEDGQWEFMTKE